MSIEDLGALCFGMIVGWIVYRTLRRTQTSGISDIATVLAAIGGGVVTAIFIEPRLFAWYSIGLIVGFVAYLVLGHTVFKKSPWLGRK